MSFLLNLYKYREREKINQLENYCTEALKYCLENDEKLRSWLLEKIKLQVDSGEQLIGIKTQKRFPESNVQPDIFIEYNNSVIVIESKIESDERKGQLKDYATLLHQNFEAKQNKHLVYLTKYPDKDYKNRNFESIHFTSLLWSQLCNSIKDGNDHFSYQLQSFIQGTIMKTIREIDQRDIDALQRIEDTLDSYEGFLNECRDAIKTELHFNFSKSNLKKAWLNPKMESGLIDECSSANFKCYLWFGIFKKDNDVVTGAEIGVYDSNISGDVEKLKTILQEKKATSYTDVYKNDSYKAYYFFESLKNFDGHDKLVIEEWFKEKLKTIIKCTDEMGLHLSSKE